MAGSGASLIQTQDLQLVKSATLHFDAQCPTPRRFNAASHNNLRMRDHETDGGLSLVLEFANGYADERDK